MLLSLFAACKGGSGSDLPPGSTIRQVEIPSEWQAADSAVVLRLTNSSTASTEVKRALNEIFNDPVNPIDGVDFLMRRPEKDDNGDYLPVDTSLSTAELLAGSSLDQLEAYKQKILDGDRVPFAREEALDACGNELIMTVASPHVLQQVFPEGPQNLDVWPSSCPDGADCETASQGTWDVGMGEMRFDGMVDMVVNVFPDLAVEPPKPAAWGHFEAFFLTGNNPGTPWLSLFLSARRVQVNVLNLWQLDRTYVDPMGVREVFKFPHRSRTLTKSDVFVFFEGFEKTEAYWNSQGLGDSMLPYGTLDGSPVLIDQTSATGEAVARAAGSDTMILSTLTDIFTYQVGLAVSCPTVRETAYLRNGPVEFFLCPDIDIGTCMAIEDMEEGACTLQEEQPFDPFNPFVPALEFSRVLITAPGQTVPMGEDRLPQYLSAPVASLSTSVELTVSADTVLYMLNPEHITAAVNATNQIAVQLPAASANTHCPDDTVQRFDIGAAWGAGTYRLTVDYTAGSGVEESTDLLGTTEYLLWMYPTSVPTWTSTGG
ncbi:MAG: hypothetical protein H6737_19555 [Alphaproteobacteria bacterium]|nr:hypothetical protein [Alphaproteobacteria bacterium]